MSTKKQTLVLIVTRTFSPPLIPQLKVILPMLKLLSPTQLYTSDCLQIPQPLYPNLILSFQSPMTVHPLQTIIQTVLSTKTSSTSTNKLRLCILGQQDVSWKTVLSCKRKQVAVDVLGKNAYLPFWTGGIHRNLKENENMLNAFILDFGINTELRGTLATSRSRKVEFNAFCVCCNKKIKEAYVCSVCCAVYCEGTKRKGVRECMKCGYQYDLVEV